MFCFLLFKFVIIFSIACSAAAFCRYLIFLYNNFVIIYKMFYFNRIKLLSISIFNPFYKLLSVLPQPYIKIPLILSATYWPNFYYTFYSYKTLLLFFYFSCLSFKTIDLFCYQTIKLECLFIFQEALLLFINYSLSNRLLGENYHKKLYRKQ